MIDAGKSCSRRDFIRRLVSGSCALAAFELYRWTPALASDLTPARFYEKHENQVVECHLCFRGCIIEPGETGHCDVRINKKGSLYTFSYGNPGSMNIDPIEKKPFYHFFPGTTSFSIGLIGCNIDCKFCQNWQIAQAKPGDIRTESMSPSEIVRKAQSIHQPTIAYTYSEPTVWMEYVIDCARVAKEKGLRSVVVTSGTISREALDELLPCIDAIKIDLKSIREDYYRDVCNGRLKPVLDNIIHIRKTGKWLELVNLVVTTLNDSDDDFLKMARWIKENIGDDVPLHLTRFHPMYQLQNLPPTPITTLDKGFQIATSEGLKFVYVGNVPGHTAQDTKCPACKTLLIERKGFRIESNVLTGGCCPTCRTHIPGVWS